MERREEKSTLVEQLERAVENISHIYYSLNVTHWLPGLQEFNQMHWLNLSDNTF
jgi:hypothetical protein